MCYIMYKYCVFIFSSSSSSCIKTNVDEDNLSNPDNQIYVVLKLVKMYYLYDLKKLMIYHV